MKTPTQIAEPEDHLAHLSKDESNQLIAHLVYIGIPSFRSQLIAVALYGLAAVAAALLAANSYGTKSAFTVLLTAAAAGVSAQLALTYAQSAYVSWRDRHIVELIETLENRLDGEDTSL
jgi:hypothetical protein